MALVGERFDGHDFVDDALARGATGCRGLPDRGRRGLRCGSITSPTPSRPSGSWPSTGETGSSAKVVGITGSSGKTTTKDLLGAALRGASGFTPLPGNLNNRIGFP